jgi:hypothetical protein
MDICTWLAARTTGLVVALGFIALSAGCSPSRDHYSCFYSDTSGADRSVDGRTLHWCGPVPRAKN